MLSIVWIPQANGFVPTPTRKHITLRRKRHGINDVRMTSEGSFQFPCLSIPQSDRSVSTSASKRVAIWTEG